KRFGPPPGFPLASSWPSIVHYLSGPNIYALGTRRHIRPPPAETGDDRSSWRVPDLRPPRRSRPAKGGARGLREREGTRAVPGRKTGREEYRLFARREGHAGEGQGSAGASELGSTAASDQSPVPGRPRRSDRRGGKTRAPGDPRTGALENAPRPTSERRTNAPPVPTRTRASDARSPTRRGDLLRGEDRPPAPGRRRGPLPVLAPSAQKASGTGSRHARCRLPAGRRTESPQFDLRISARNPTLRRGPFRTPETPLPANEEEEVPFRHTGLTPSLGMRVIHEQLRRLGSACRTSPERSTPRAPREGDARLCAGLFPFRSHLLRESRVRPCPSSTAGSPGPGRGTGQQAGWFNFGFWESASPAPSEHYSPFGPVAGRPSGGGSRTTGRPSLRPSVPAGRRRRKRANPPRLEGTSGRGSEFLPKGSGNPRPLWSGELPRAESPAREPAGEAGEAGRQARRHMPRRRPRRPPAVAAAPAPPARSRTEPSAGKAGRRAPDPVVLLRNRSPPTPPRGGGGGERHLHGAVSPHSQKILVAAFPEDGRRARGSEQPAAVRTVSREATSRHSREGGSRPSKKAQGRRNVRSTRRWNHGRIAIATKTSLLAAVFLDPRAK
ncbi:serine/arginine repetitive matrix protein 1-like, partial [Penaeus indicus]|uniref:serine/arginine repetitive matrix protein 1-like n=1 Tax=Penaeus indicus TaxID=29960 RepID=UPI00300D6065